MPFAEFNNGNAGLALGEFMLRSQDQAMSLMERAQRMQVVQSDLDMRKEQHAADLTTTSLRQDALRAEVGKSQIDLKEAERKASELANIRDEYAAAAPKIAESISQISKVRDFGTQRRLFNELQSQSSRFYGDPELAARLDRTFGPLQKTVEANQKSHVAQAIASNRAAPTEDIARQKFPGYHVEFATDPHTGNGVWISSDEPDRVAEARAIGLLSLAEDESDLKQAISDPTVNMMLGVPGSRASELYRTQRAKLKTESQTDAEIGVKRATAGGGKQIPASLFESTEKMRNSYASLQDIKKTFDSDKGMHGPFVGLVRDMNPWDTDAKTLAAKVTAAVPMLARGVFGEVGVLTDKDMEVYRSLLPNTRSPEAAAKALFQFLSQKLEGVYNGRVNSLRKQGYNTSGFDEIGAKGASGPVSGSRAQALARGASGSP